MGDTPNGDPGTGADPAPPTAAPGEPAVAALADNGPAPSKVEQAFGLWPRIKEHKILQWGVGYLGAALALAHGQELLAQAYDWPHSVGRIFMGLLIVGLPVVVTFAWYHGHKGLKRFSAAEMTIVALLLLIGGGGFFLFVNPDEHGVPIAAQSAALAPTGATGEEASTQPPLATATETGVSLAVLPFADMSPEGDQEYFSDGLSEELLNQLAQIKDLRVAGRTSSFSFKGKNEDLRTIGQKLGVNHLLEGSVRKAGTRLRITAQLINAADGSHLWSQSYDRELTDVFKVQEDIAKDVTEALSITLGVGDMPRLSAAGTTNLEAYDKYLRAGALFRNPGSPVDYVRAVAMYREALALDPDFAPARGALAVTYAIMLIVLPETSDQTLKAMDETVQEALARAPDHWASHLANGVLLMQRRDRLEADAALAKARALAPLSESNVGAISGLFLIDVGRISQAVRVLEAARNADPLSPLVTSILQVTLDLVGRPGDAQAEHERTKDLAKSEVTEHQALIRLWDSGDAAAIKAQARRFFDSEVVPMPVLNEVYDVFDQPQAALNLLRSAFKDPAYQDGTRMFLLGLYAAHFGDNALALAAMRRSFIDMKTFTLQMIWYPVLSDARKTPEFKDLARDLGLVDYWRASGNWGEFCRPLGTDDFECR